MSITADAPLERPLAPTSSPCASSSRRPVVALRRRPQIRRHRSHSRRGRLLETRRNPWDLIGRLPELGIVGDDIGGFGCAG